MKEDQPQASFTPIEPRGGGTVRATTEASYAAAVCNGSRPTRSQSDPVGGAGVIAPPENMRRVTMTEAQNIGSPSRTATLYDVSNHPFSSTDSVAGEMDRFNGAPGLSYPVPDSGSWADAPTAYQTSSASPWFPSSVHASPSSATTHSLFSNGLASDFSPPHHPAHPGQRVHSLSSDGYSLTAGTDWAHGVPGFSNTYGSPSSTLPPNSHLHDQGAFMGRAHSLSDPVVMPSSPLYQFSAMNDPLPPLSLPPPEQQSQQQSQSAFYAEPPQSQSPSTNGHPSLFPGIGNPMFSGNYADGSVTFTSESLNSAALGFSQL